MRSLAQAWGIAAEPEIKPRAHHRISRKVVSDLWALHNSFNDQICAALPLPDSAPFSDHGPDTNHSITDCSILWQMLKYDNGILTSADCFILFHFLIFEESHLFSSKLYFFTLSEVETSHRRTLPTGAVFPTNALLISTYYRQSSGGPASLICIQ